MYKRIVVGTDGSETASEAVGKAAGLAASVGCPLHLVSVFRTASMALAATEIGLATPDLGDWMVRVADDTATMLEDVARPLLANGLGVKTHVVSGEPADAIMRVAKETEADLIVIGNKGMRGARRVLGSIPNTISHQSPCDVLIVHTC